MRYKQNLGEFSLLVVNKAVGDFRKLDKENP